MISNRIILVGNGKCRTSHNHQREKEAAFVVICQFIHTHKVTVQYHLPSCTDIGKTNESVESITELRPMVFLLPAAAVADKVPVTVEAVIVNAYHIPVFQFRLGMIITMRHHKTEEKIISGSFGNPWLFRQGQAAIDGEDIPPLPPLAQRCDTAVRQFELSAAHKGEHIACLEARKHYAWYLKGVPHANYYKEQIVQMNTLEDAERITRGIQRDLRD